MSNSMGSENLQILRHLAQIGESTVADLMAVTNESRPSLNIRLASMESLGWLQKTSTGKHARLWYVAPNAYEKLATVGIYARPPAPKHPRKCPSDKAPITGEVVQPRRTNIYEEPVWKGTQFAAPVRAGALDFKAYPSRGFSC